MCARSIMPWDHQRIMEIIDFMRNLYTTNAKPTSKYYGLCRKYGRMSKNIVEIGIGFFMTGGLLVTQITTIEYFQTGELKPCLNIHYPGSHSSSGVMNVILVLYNYSLPIFGALTVIAGDLLFSIAFAHIPMAASIIQGQIQELEDDLVNPRSSERQIRVRIMQYLYMHRKFNE